jgi:glycosyltransferase involved in cell wall biosynthesis
MTVPPSHSRRRPALPTPRLLVCFSHLRWDFVHQRPQHLLSRAARTGPVLYVEEPVAGPEGRAPRMDVRRSPEGVEVATPVLPADLPAADAAAAVRAMLDGVLAARPARRLVAWYYTPMALAFSGHLAPDACVYDCMDELSAFRDAPEGLRALERRLFRRADLVFAGGRSLFEAKSRQHPRVHAFPSSIDAAHFGRARALRAAPADAEAPPRLGWFGVIDERMDLDLVAAVADMRPDWRIEMVGPVAKIDPASLPRRPNIAWPGQRPYRELPELLAGWDVGLMPFAMNGSTRFISPTKTPEYLAAGVPVVSTPVPDVVSPWGEAGLVEIAATAPEAVARAEAVVARPRGPWLERVDRTLAGMSWDRTWTEMEALVDRVLASDPANAPAAARASAAAGAARV